MIMWELFFTIVCAAIFVLGIVTPFYISIKVWMDVKAMKDSTHTVVPMNSNAFADFQKEIDSITGGSSSQLFGDLDPANLGNFERFDEDRSV